MKSSRWWVLGFSCLLWSCASTDVGGIWKDTQNAMTIQKIFIIGLGDNPDRRQTIEDSLSATFIREGKQAVPSSIYFDNTAMINEKTISPVVNENEINAVIVARIVKEEKEQRNLPAAYPAHYKSFYSYYNRYGQADDKYNEPGYSLKETLVSLEINLYRTSNARLVWALKTETFLAENINREISKISKKIMYKLRQDELL